MPSGRAGRPRPSAHRIGLDKPLPPARDVAVLVLSVLGLLAVGIVAAEVIGLLGAPVWLVSTVRFLPVFGVPLLLQRVGRR